MTTLTLGDWTLHTVEAGFLWLDGGSMFGSVPKPLWNRTNPADERNRIRLAMRCWLLRGHGRTVLVDDGLGDKFTDKLRDIYRVEAEPSLEHSLAALGVKPGDVTDVVLTHLHFDHAGGLDLVPRAATVVLPKADLEADAEENNFRAVDYETGHPRIETEGDYDLFGDGAIVLHPTPGHTPGHQSVIVDGDVLIAADACYFPENVDEERFPAYGWDRDLERESLGWIREQRDSGLTVLYGHEPSAGTFQRP